MTMSNQYNSNRIALWGPHSSGKTWYIKAFGRKLREFADNSDFYYELFEGNEVLYRLIQAKPDEKVEIPIDFDPNDTKTIKATEQSEDIVWTFRRRAKQSSPRHVVSTHAHKVHIVDNKGEDTVELKLAEVLINIVKSAGYLLLMLDPTKLTTYKGSRLESELVYEPHKYLELVENLFTQLSAYSQAKRYIAVCVTKIDQLTVKERDPWELIQIFFEQPMVNLLNKYIDPQKFVLETFSVSAVGFYVSDGKLMANYDAATGNLSRPEIWRPHNVEAPLFWIFDKIEREILRSGGNSLLSRFLFATRSKLYIPYPIQRQ